MSGPLTLMLAEPDFGNRLKARIVSNYGAENDSLEQLLRNLGLLERAGIEAEFIKVNGPLRNLEELESGNADLCVLSGLNPLPNIEAGSPVKLIGSAMKLTALAVFSKSPAIRTVRDLAGRTIGIGPRNYLLHVTMVAMLRKNAMDARDVKFAEIGGNAQVFQAVASGQVDAGPASVVSFHSLEKRGVHALCDANMWKGLPEYTSQIMYASDRAIAGKREVIVRVLSAYAALFRFLQDGNAWEAYAQARAAALPHSDVDESKAVFSFVQEQRPYGRDILLSEARLAYMQDLNAEIGIIKTPMASERVADMSMARDAMKLLN